MTKENKNPKNNDLKYNIMRGQFREIEAIANAFIKADKEGKLSPETAVQNMRSILIHVQEGLEVPSPDMESENDNN